MTNQKYIYVTINEQTVFLTLICRLLNISYYKMFLLYEVFGNDLFFIFDILKSNDTFRELTQYRINRYHRQASSIYRAISSKDISSLSVTERRSFNLLSNMIIEDKFKFQQDSEVQ